MKFEYPKEDGLGDYEGMYSAVVILIVGLFGNFHFILVFTLPDNIEVVLLPELLVAHWQVSSCLDVGNG